MKKFLTVLFLMLIMAGSVAWYLFKPGGPGLVWFERPPEFGKDIEPILASYCYDCHADGIDKGDIVLDEYESTDELFADWGLWEGIYSNLEGSLMPPSDKSQPTDEEREKIIAWIERKIFKLDPENPDPGRVTIRRLNREEYNNTIRDLVGLDLRPADNFPEDDTGYGFDNVGDVLSLSPALMERYLKASGAVLDAAIVTEAPLPITRDYESGRFRGRQRVDDGTGSLSSSGTVGVQFKAPEDGEYRIDVFAGGSQARKEWPIMRVKMENGPQKDFRVNASRTSPIAFTLQTKLKKDDERWIDMSFLNDYYDPQAKDPKQRDRNLYIQRLRVTGPLDRPVPAPSEAHRNLLAPADPTPDETSGRSAREIADVVAENAGPIVRRFAERAWRRPVSDDELNRVMEFFRSRLKEGGTFDESAKLAFQAVLVSPHFLFRGEVQPDPDNPERVHLIDEFALASRLSYFLWSSMPDDELFALAKKDQLRANLDAQIDRMLADPKAAEALTANFAGQWLQLRNLQLSTPDKNTFKAWDDNLREAMRGETEHFFASMVRENRSVLEVLDADYTFANERLARHYGLPEMKGAEFQRVALTGKLREQRGGILSHGSILTITSNPTRTSAVNRGNYVLENILGTPAPPPPEGVDVPPLEASGKGGNEDKTLRQQLEIHREKPMCASCHARMDPIGFGLENFDAIGAWRDTEKGKPIDAAGELYTGETFNSPAQLRKILMERKKEAFLRCLAEKALTYALGRGLEYYDKPAMSGIARRTAARGYRFHELIRAVVHSVPFQLRRGDGS